MRILFNSKDERFKEPFGCLKPGEACRMTVLIPASCKTKKAELVLERENGEDLMRVALRRDGEKGGYESFTCRFALAETGLYFYYFRVTTPGESFSLFRCGFDQTNMEAGEKWQLSCIPASFHTPSDWKGGVMYQIFPDRFFRAGSPDLSGKMQPFTLHENTADIPSFLPDENGEVKNCDFFGGNLKGIEEKLDYLKTLGVSVIYLNPIFKAWSNHRYDTADYKKIDEMLGTEEDFSRLCAEAHKKGMKIILDGVFSHTGSRSVYFDEKDEFGQGCATHPDSPYRSWFEFQHYPDTYTSWWGIKTLPCTRELDPGYLDFIIRSQDSVIAHWLRAGADGFRLDVADELPDEFILLLRKRVKEIKPDALLLGEVWEDASNKISYSVRRRYFTDGELDSVMNYPFRSAVIDLLTGKDNGKNFCETVLEITENYPQEVLPLLMNSVSTHDTARALSLFSPSPAPADKKERAGFRMGEGDRKIAEEKLLNALFLQVMLPGMPCVFYGDEIGTEGWEDPFCRAYFDWNRTNKNPILDAFRAALSLRGAHPALREGKTDVQTDEKGRVFIKRQSENETLIAAVNCGENLEWKMPGEVIFSRGTGKTPEGKTLLPTGACLLCRIDP